MNLGDHQDLGEESEVATFCCDHLALRKPLGPPGCGGTICNTRHQLTIAKFYCKEIQCLYYQPMLGGNN